jgi:hypothetical protein
MKRDTLLSRTVKRGSDEPRRQVPDLTKCPHCEAIFFLHNVWAQKETEIGEEPPGTLYRIEPGPEDYRKALEKGLAKNTEEETHLREYINCR